MASPWVLAPVSTSIEVSRKTPKSDKRRDPSSQEAPCHPEPDTLSGRGQRDKKHSVDGSRTRTRR